MIACGISRDPVIARRTVKTLVMGDSKGKKNGRKSQEGESDETGAASLVRLPPAPPKSTSYQEYVGTCKPVLAGSAFSDAATDDAGKTPDTEDHHRGAVSC